MTDRFTGISFPRMKPFIMVGTIPVKMCQWIEGAPSEDDACKCGLPVQTGTSYCVDHYVRSIDKSPRAKYIKNLYKPKKEGSTGKDAPLSSQGTNAPAATD